MAYSKSTRLLLLTMLPFGPALADTFETESTDIRVAEVTGGLQNPWGFVFLPEGDVLLTERPGRLRLWDGEELHTVEGVPPVEATGQGGMLDVALHPDFADNRLVYLTHSAAYDGGVGTVVTRGRLDAEARILEEVETIYRMPAPGAGGQHFGSRMAFDAEGYLFVSVGDRGNRHAAQDLGRAEGTLLRLHDNGSIPADNPFTDDPDALDEIWSYGHRNAQGLFYDFETGILWQHEHGPRGGDTLNAITRGANYGWPVATYGDEYGSGVEIGDLPHEREEIENPFAYWVPTSIAPSGLTLYRGHALPHWRGQIFLGTLAQQHIRRLVFDDAGVVHEEEILRGEFGRIRDIRTGPDDLLYFVTDQNPGGLYRIEPAEVSWWFGLPATGGWRASGEADAGGDIGWLYDGYWPWVALARLGGEPWLWVAEAQSTPEAITAYRAADADGNGSWIHLRTEEGWYFDYSEENWYPLPGS